jgi:transcriptional regulator with XRE-family HTH domain
MHPLKKEFQELFKKSGWSQAETARRLDLTRGGVNGIITGPAVPSKAAIKLFRYELGQLDGKGSNYRSALEKIDRLPPESRDRILEVLNELVDAALSAYAAKVKK